MTASAWRSGRGTIKVAIGISGFVLIFAAWTLAMATTTPRVHLPVTLALFFGGPLALLPLGASVYRAVLARWQTDVLPTPLVLGLDRLRDRTGCIFDRVLCLDAAFGNGRLCEVVSTPRQATLIVSAGVTEVLEPDELLAILAHEAAHVQLRHLRRKLAVGVPAGRQSANRGRHVRLRPQCSHHALNLALALMSRCFEYATIVVGGEVRTEQRDRGERQRSLREPLQDNWKAPSGARRFDTAIGRVLREVQHLRAIGEHGRAPRGQVQPSGVEFGEQRDELGGRLPLGGCDAMDFSRERIIGQALGPQ
jgi:hypothetical protein